MDPNLAAGHLDSAVRKLPERDVHCSQQVPCLPFIRPPDVQNHQARPVPFGGEPAEVGYPVAGDLPIGGKASRARQWGTALGAAASKAYSPART